MGKPGNTQKYPTNPEILDGIFRPSYPARTRPGTRYFIQYPTRPDIKKTYPLATANYPGSTCFARALHNEANFGTEQPSQICLFLLMYLGVVVSLSFYFTVFDQLPSGGTCFACALYNEANFGTEQL